jgi:hypothetical protein
MRASTKRQRLGCVGEARYAVRAHLRAREWLRIEVAQVNRLIRDCADDQHVFYAEIGDVLLASDGLLSAEISPDQLHLTARGYALLGARPEPELERLLSVEHQRPNREARSSMRSSAKRLLEGIIAERADEPYSPGDRGVLVKVKCENVDKLVVVGWTDPG